VSDWLTSGLREVTLPSGHRVRGVLPTAERLIVQGTLPTELRAVAMRFAVGSVNPSELADKGETDILAQFLSFARVLAAEFVRDRWVDDGWVPTKLTPADLDNIDPADVDALQVICLRHRTPEQITAASLGQKVEEAGPVEALAEFRRDATSPADSPDGGTVEPPAVKAPRAKRPRPRVSGGRGAAPPPVG